MSGSVPYGRKTVESGVLTISTGSVALEHIPGTPVDPIRAGIVVTTSTTGASPTIFTITRRVTAGSASGAVTVGTVTVPSGTVAGKAVYADMDERVTIDVGESLHMVSNNGADAGAGVLFFELLVRPFVGTRIADATEVALG